MSSRVHFVCKTTLWAVDKQYAEQENETTARNMSECVCLALCDWNPYLSCYNHGIQGKSCWSSRPRWCLCSLKQCTIWPIRGMKGALHLVLWARRSWVALCHLRAGRGFCGLFIFQQCVVLRPWGQPWASASRWCAFKQRPTSTKRNTQILEGLRSKGKRDGGMLHSRTTGVCQNKSEFTTTHGCFRKAEPTLLPVHPQMAASVLFRTKTVDTSHVANVVAGIHRQISSKRALPCEHPELAVQAAWQSFLAAWRTSWHQLQGEQQALRCFGCTENEHPKGKSHAPQRTHRQPIIEEPTVNGVGVRWNDL